MQPEYQTLYSGFKQVNLVSMLFCINQRITKRANKIELSLCCLI